MSLAAKLKELRTQRQWTQLEVAKRSGLDRRYISYLEQPRHTGRPSADAFLWLAHAFNIKVEELYQAAGYIKEAKDLSPHLETPEEILDRLRLTFPVAIPIYSDFPFHAGEDREPVDYIYRVRHKAIGKDVEGYLVHGNCLEPQVCDKDIIIIDRRGDISSDDIVACLIDDQLCVARLREIADELWLENNVKRVKLQDCLIAAPVIEIRRRLK